jgi:SAM-dependent methyltransferase
MFQKIYSIFNSKSFNSRILQTLILLAIFFIIINTYNRFHSNKLEGFRQSDRYILKEDENIYDDFYARIYDDLMLSENRSKYEISKVIEMTEPSKDYSIFLDIGSGTGHSLNYLKNLGYQAYGIDKSKAMVGFSQTKFPDISVKCGDIKDPIIFDRGTYTHILCTGMTIYEFENKWLFFQNCYFWLQHNGYLIIHLVDREKFNTIIPAGKIEYLDNPQRYSNSRITDTIIDFIDFKYTSSYNFNDSKVIHKEKFTDTKTQNIRENEKTLYMNTIKEILLLATKYGFLVKGKINMQDEGEYLYIFERMM